MEKYERKKLNIIRLLECGDLDIRKIASKNPSLRADEYFSTVECIIESASDLKDSFISITQMSDDVKALKELEAKLGVDKRRLDFSSDNESVRKLEGIKDSLAKIGYDELDKPITQLCAAIARNDLQSAEKLAKEAHSRFSELIERISGAYSLKRHGKNDAERTPDNPMTLKEALDYFDHVEENRKLRVLAVDDVAVVLNSVTSILSPHYEVFALKNSSQVEKFLAHTSPELFLLDIEMEEMHGFDLIPVIRKFEKHKETPIIFLTGNASLANVKDAVALGACDFITKPVSKDVLLEKIAKNIVRRKAY